MDSAKQTANLVFPVPAEDMMDDREDRQTDRQKDEKSKT